MIEYEVQDEDQLEVVKTIKGECLKSLAVTASILILSIPEDRIIHRRIRELYMSIRMDTTTHSTLDFWPS